MAVGYVMPPRRTSDWCAMALLDQALHGGRAGRVYRELVLEKQIAVEADGGVDDIFGYDGPSQMTTRHFSQAGNFQRRYSCCLRPNRSHNAGEGN